MFVHGLNLTQKETHRTKYLDPESRQYLAEIRDRYDKWHEANLALLGPFSKSKDEDMAIVSERVQLLEAYKNFIDQQKYAEKFDSRSNLHSTVLEEFLYYLFRDVVADFGKNALIGRAHAFKDIFFVPPNYKEMTEQVHARIEQKDHDFVIGVSVEAKLAIKAQPIEERPLRYETRIEAEHLFDIPAVAIECKTYLDKTMLEGSSSAAEQLKARNPNALYIVIMEWLKLTNAVNLKKYELDQIYVFRRQRNTDREFRFEPDYVKNPLDPNLAWHLYETVRNHLTTDWESTIERGLERGWLL